MRNTAPIIKRLKQEKKARQFTEATVCCLNLSFQTGEKLSFILPDEVGFLKKLTITVLEMLF